MSNARTLALLAAVGVAVATMPSSVDAQEGEKKLGWANAAELSLVVTAGNAKTSTFGFRNELAHVWEDAKLLVEASGVRTKTGTISRSAVGTSPDDFDVVKDTQTELTAEKYLARAKYDHNVTERVFVFGSGGWDRNEFAGIQNRYFGAGGLGNVWFDREDARWRTDYGLSATHEQGTVSSTRTFAGLRLSSDFMRKLTASTTLTNITVIDENLSDLKDFRLDALSAVAVAMSDHLALKVSLQLLFDADPAFIEAPLQSPPGNPTGTNVLIQTDELDTHFSVALVVSF
jgi:hypothetical protein